MNLGNVPATLRRYRTTSFVGRMLKLHKNLARARSQAKKNATQSQITVTDRQIDALVYELYELMEEEIRIVEGGQE